MARSDLFRVSIAFELSLRLDVCACLEPRNITSKASFSLLVDQIDSLLFFECGFWLTSSCCGCIKVRKGGLDALVFIT